MESELGAKIYLTWQLAFLNAISLFYNFAHLSQLRNRYDASLGYLEQWALHAQVLNLTEIAHKLLFELMPVRLV